MAVSGKKSSKIFSSTLSRACAENFDLLCQPCDLDDIRQPAFGYCVDCEEHLCESCFNIHRRPRPLRHHKLLSTDDMPKSLNVTTKLTAPGENDDLTEPCVKHRKEIIKYYCNDHKKLLCSVCVTLEHTPKSCHVDYIPDVSPGIVDSTEVKDTLQTLEIIAGKYNRVATTLINAVKRSNTSIGVVLADIGKFREDVNKRLDELDKEAEDAGKTLKQENDTTLVRTKTACDDVAKTTKVVSASIKHLNETKQEDNLFIELKKAKEIIKDTEEMTSKINNSADIKKFSFAPLKDMIMSLNNEKSLGTITDKPLVMDLYSRTAPLRAWNSQSDGKFDVSTSSNVSGYMITDMILLNRNQFLLIDRLNRYIKIFNTTSNTVSHQLEVNSSLHSVTSLPGGKFAVTSIFENKILFFSFSSERIEQKKSLNVDGECYGISYNKGRLAVSYQYPAKLQIMDMKGTVQTTVDNSTNGETFFRYPKYISTTNNDIYVSDTGMHAVIWLNWQGQLLGRFEGLGSPKGIAMLDDGSFFVSDTRDDKCNILNISADCKESKIVLKDLQHPRALCWCEANKTIYVSIFSDEYNSNNFIQFYKMQ